MGASKVEFLDPAGYRRVPWKNGAGVTVDIAGDYRVGSEPGSWDGMIWRFSRTRIETSGPFSHLPGSDRLLAVVEGAGLLLHTDQGHTLDVRQPCRAVAFAGEWPIVSELTQGPVGVINLLADRTKFAITLTFPVAPARVALAATISIVLALTPAQISLDGAPIELAGDCAVKIASGGELTIDSGTVAIAGLIPRAATGA